METIKYLRRVNLGNYEHEELEVTTSVREGQERTEAVKSLRDFVHEALGLVEKVTSPKVETPKKENEIKGETKVQKQKPQAEAPKEEVKKEEVKKEEVKKEEPKKEEEKKESPKKETKKETTTKIKPSKATAYDRELETHKALIGQFLDGEFPNWRNKDVLPKAGKASRALQGTDFQDGEGNILDSFKVAFRPYMA